MDETFPTIGETTDAAEGPRPTEVDRTLADEPSTAPDQNDATRLEVEPT